MLEYMSHQKLQNFLSPERLATYLRMVQNNDSKAIDLYRENLKCCGEFYTQLHWLEIGLRNAINRILSEKYGSEWFFNAQIGLSEKDKIQIQKARERLVEDRKVLTNGNFVAQLSFGFWVNLFNPHYETLWRQCLRRVFVLTDGKLERKKISGMLHPILKLRNRIAHYEPIMKYDLHKMQLDIVNVVKWIEGGLHD